MNKKKQLLEQLDREEGHTYAWGGGGLVTILIVVLLIILIF